MQYTQPFLPDPLSLYLLNEARSRFIDEHAEAFNAIYQDVVDESPRLCRIATRYASVMDKLERHDFGDVDIKLYQIFDNLRRYGEPPIEHAFLQSINAYLSHIQPQKIQEGVAPEGVGPWLLHPQEQESIYEYFMAKVGIREAITYAVEVQLDAQAVDPQHEAEMDAFFETLFPDIPHFRRDWLGPKISASLTVPDREALMYETAEAIATHSVERWKTALWQKAAGQGGQPVNQAVEMYDHFLFVVARDLLIAPLKTPALGWRGHLRQGQPHGSPKEIACAEELAAIRIAMEEFYTPRQITEIERRVRGFLEKELDLRPALSVV